MVGKKIWAINAHTADLICGPRPFYGAWQRLCQTRISASEGRREYNNHLKMIRRSTLVGTQQGLNAVKCLFIELLPKMWLNADTQH